ncbi:MAG TPA: SLBB domain-containing protein [Atribacterota bacterium]|nr:SLBB domain-containing protein [Atribacterota bacterium]
MLKYSMKTKSLNFAILVLLFLLMITFFFNNSFSSFANESSPNYFTLSPYDVLEIRLWGYPDLTTSTVVQPDGMISLPLSGQIYAAGKTLEELKIDIADELKKILTSLGTDQVGLTIINFGTINISVLGEVNNPGIYPLTGRVDVLKAISAASGLTEKAGMVNATIIRKSQTTLPVDLEKLFLLNDLTQNYTLESGDSLYIPKAFTITNISIAGEVNSPGLYSLEGKVDILKAISACKGVTEKANLKDALITKLNNEVIPVDLEKLFLQNDLTQNYSLESGDSLFVPLSLENNIYVLGEVKSPGLYPIKEECTVVKAITLAGGYTANARLKSCVVIRRFPTDEEGIKMQTITLKDVKVIREKYEQVIEINLVKILKDGELDQNIVLQPRDIVFIPIKPLSEFDIATILDVVTTGLGVYNVLK